MMRKAVVPVALVACAWLAACSDGTGPDVSPLSPNGLYPDFDGEGGQIAILRHSTAAPPLETYEESVEACHGRPAELEIRYVASADDDEPSKLLRLSIPAFGLWKHPDGSSVRPGDCILITATLDAHYLLAEFHPAGLRFRPAFPAALTVSYAEADADLDGDGDMDEDDARLEESELAVWRLPHDDERWQRVPSVHLLSDRRFISQLKAFSHYAVAH